LAKKQQKKNGLSLAQLAANLNKGHLSPVYLVAGEETFLADEARRRIAEAAQLQAGTCSTSSYHGDEVDLATVLDDLRTLDLFSPGRLVTVSPANRFVQAHPDALVAYAEAPPSNAWLTLVTGKVDGRLKLTKTVLKLGGLVLCNRVYPREVLPWIMGRVKLMNRQIDPNAAQLLAEFLGTDLAAIAGELDKLRVYIGDRTRITEQDVAALSLRDRTRDIFELTDGIGHKQGDHVLVVLNRLLEQGEAPIRVLAGVSWHLRRLWAAKELINNGKAPNDAASEVGVRYFVGQFLAQVNGFSLSELRRNCSALMRCDAALKSSALDPRVLLETTFLRLVRRGQGRTRRAAR